MRLPLTLSLYIGRQFFYGIFFTLLGITCIIGLLDMVELIRRAADRPEVTFSIIVEMALFKMPKMAERALPFAVLIGGMISLTRLTRTHELVVTRAAGISVWQFLAPAIILTLGIGVFSMTVFNPISSALELRFEQLDGKYFKGRPSFLAVSSSGLWLRQTDAGPYNEHIIHAQRVSQKDMSLQDVVVFSFGEHDRFVRRIDADSATLEHGYWNIRHATLSSPGQPPETAEQIQLTTDLTIEQIQDSFASPKTMSFWQLPGFIRILEHAGFSALKHRLHFYSLMASPLLLCGMILIAATFSLRLPRFGGMGWLVVAGVVTGFTVRFMTDLVNALGLSGSLPVTLAAWTPASICLMLGTALLLHLEDG